MDVIELMKAVKKTPREVDPVRGLHDMDLATGLSEAVELYLKYFPRKNTEEFEARFAAPEWTGAVREILDETMRVHVDSTGKSLNDIGDGVESVMKARYPELSASAIESLGNYFTYVVK